MKKLCLFLLLVGFLTFSQSAFAGGWIEDETGDWKPKWARIRYSLYENLYMKAKRLKTTINNPKVFYLTITTSDLDYRLLDPSIYQICDFPSQEPDDYVVMERHGRVGVDIHRAQKEHSASNAKQYKQKVEKIMNEFEQEKTKILTSELSRKRIKKLVAAIERKKENILGLHGISCNEEKEEVVQKYEETLKVIQKEITKTEFKEEEYTLEDLEELEELEEEFRICSSYEYDKKAEKFLKEFEQDKTKVLTSGLSEKRIEELITTLEISRKILEENNFHFFDSNVKTVDQYLKVLTIIEKAFKDKERKEQKRKRKELKAQERKAQERIEPDRIEQKRKEHERNDIAREIKETELEEKAIQFEKLYDEEIKKFKEIKYKAKEIRNTELREKALEERNIQLAKFKNEAYLFRKENTEELQKLKEEDLKEEEDLQIEVELQAEELKERQEKELKERQEKELKERQEKELKERQEKELKERQEKELKERREKELQEAQKQALLNLYRGRGSVTFKPYCPRLDNITPNDFTTFLALTAPVPSVKAVKTKYALITKQNSLPPLAVGSIVVAALFTVYKITYPDWTAKPYFKAKIGPVDFHTEIDWNCNSTNDYSISGKLIFNF
jgi:hypothetical protein